MLEINQLEGISAPKNKKDNVRNESTISIAFPKQDYVIC